MNIYLQRLLASGLAQEGNFIIANPVAVLPVPPKKVLVITEIRCSHFCNLKPSEDFSDSDAVESASQYQIHVYSNKGGSYFQWRNTYQKLFDSGKAEVLIPNGETKFETFMPHTTDVMFELTKLVNLDLFTPSSGKIPAKSSIPLFAAPPGGVGTEANGGINTVLSLTYVNGVTEFWLYNPVKAIDKTGPQYKDTQGFNLPGFPSFRVGGPNVSIDWAVYTFPLVQVKYVIINKLEDLSVQGSL